MISSAMAAAAPENRVLQRAILPTCVRHGLRDMVDPGS
jgi:hypothetical protein